MAFMQTIVVADPALCAELLGPNAWRLQGVDKSTQDLYNPLHLAPSPFPLSTPLSPHHPRPLLQFQMYRLPQITQFDTSFASEKPRH